MNDVEWIKSKREIREYAGDYIRGLGLDLEATGDSVLANMIDEPMCNRYANVTFKEYEYSSLHVKKFVNINVYVQIYGATISLMPITMIRNQHNPPFLSEYIESNITPIEDWDD